MKDSTTKACSRCKKKIECRTTSIEECACSKVVLSAECLEFLKLTRYDCLCNSCLLELNLLVEKADSAPTNPTEKVHYYIEDGKLVFTELNHIQRGYCCGSDCRHCAYGFGIE